MNEAEHAEVVAFVGEAELAAQTFHGDVADNEVGLCGRTVRDDGALDVGNDGLDVRLIEAEDGGAVERNAIHKFGEDGLNFFERTVLSEMFTINCRDDGHDGCVVKEAAVAFVGFDDEVFAFAEASSRAGLIELTAHDKSWVEVRGGEDRGDHGGRGG